MCLLLKRVYQIEVELLKFNTTAQTNVTLCGSLMKQPLLSQQRCNCR
jgi:hypothetical protein